MTNEQDEVAAAAKAADKKNKMIAYVIGTVIAVGVGWFVYDQEYFGENAPTTQVSIDADKASCIDAIRSLSEFPDKTDFLPDVKSPGHDVRRTIEGRVELADDKGNMYRHTFTCIMENGVVVDKVAERG